VNMMPVLYMLDEFSLDRKCFLTTCKQKANIDSFLAGHDEGEVLRQGLLKEDRSQTYVHEEGYAREASLDTEGRGFKQRANWALLWQRSASLQAHVSGVQGCKSATLLLPRTPNYRCDVLSCA
jgi:hypothetical protein